MRLVGVIQQNPHIFNQSLRENLLIGKGNATDDELWDALERVGLLCPRAEQLPNGLDTVIDESGKSFSGGERHRIALARILLSKPAIVILDEPFAGLDPATEQALLETMLSALESRSTVLLNRLIIFKAFRMPTACCSSKTAALPWTGLPPNWNEATNAIERCSPSTAATSAPPLRTKRNRPSIAFSLDTRPQPSEDGRVAVLNHAQRGRHGESGTSCCKA